MFDHQKYYGFFRYFAAENPVLFLVIKHSASKIAEKPVVFLVIKHSAILQI